MPLTKERRFTILRRLDAVYQLLAEKHFESAPKGGRLPVGGGDWMDTFFRMEGLRGMMTALRGNNSLRVALEEGKTVSEISVSIWNGKREYQVHRWKETAHTYLQRELKRASTT